MADAGSIYYQALSGMGDDIAKSMYQVHREHQAYDQQYGMAEALSRIGINPEGRIVPIVPDEKGKTDKSIQPIVDPKALEMFKTGNRRDWARSAGQLEALSRLGTSFLNRQQAAMVERAMTPHYQVTTPTGRTVEASAGQAIQSDLEAERGKAAAAAGQIKEERAQRREKREDIRLGMSTEKEARMELEKRPEITFSRKYGFTPQAVIGIPESRYTAKDTAGQVLGDTDPLPAGQTVETFGSAPTWWQQLKALGHAKPDPTRPQTVKWEAQNTDGQIFRETKYEYPGKAPSDKSGPIPKRERWLTDPEGSFFNVRGTRIPVDEVNAIRNSATAARDDLRNKLASPQFQSFTPEQQAAKIIQIKQRLSQLGYNPDNEFWALPQQQ